MPLVSYPITNYIMMNNLSSSHNVTPVYDKENNNEKVYQASSPDEVALVKLAESLNMKLLDRGVETIDIENCAK